ncbi:MAG: hypothetical protein FJX62_12090 [Alphaproteobacteria bacterium]|nr:hypothetical protein [Alphaproteobacteria bacterium]
MPVDHIRYDILAQEALRGLVRHVLTDAAKEGLPGDHHFFVTFDTRAAGVKLSPRLLEQYPEEMTVVLQHQFWDLKVTDEAFEVGLSFGGVAERLYVPFSAVKSFVDPSVKFALQFETLVEGKPAATEAAAETQDKDKPADEVSPAARKPARRDPARQSLARTSVPSTPLPASAPAAGGNTEPPTPPEGAPGGAQGGAEVVRLDRFRKK